LPFVSPQPTKTAILGPGTVIATCLSDGPPPFQAVSPVPAPFDNKKQARSAFPMRSAPRSAVEICPMSVIIALAALGLL
ncbi:hypothetical protein ABMZ32_25900, partial [Escherichia coli]|uniref:hypothetical protein n=1 Tax=Escherichia coli TaxID=562 RepID=UPI0039BDB1E1